MKLVKFEFNILLMSSLILIFCVFFFTFPARASVYSNSSGQTVILGTSVEIPSGDLDLTVGNITASSSTVTLSSGTLSGDGSGLTNLEAADFTSGILAVDEGGTGTANAATGTGSVVLSNSPAFTGTVTGGTFNGTHTGDGSGLTGLSNSSGFTLASNLIDLDTLTDNIAVGTTVQNGKFVVQDTDTIFNIIGGAATGLTAATESTDVNLNLSRTMTFNTGALANQRAVRLQAPTYAFTGSSTITDATTLEISGAPIAGTNATITAPRALVLTDNSTDVSPDFAIDQANASGDAAISFEAGSRTYTAGVDASDSGKFKISKATTLGAGSTEMTINSSGQFGFYGISNPTHPLEINTNTSNPILRIEGTGTNDSALAFVTDAQTMMLGIDNSTTNNNFTISDDGTDLANNVRVMMDAFGDFHVNSATSTSNTLNITSGNIFVNSSDLITDFNPTSTTTRYIGAASTPFGDGILFDDDDDVIHDSKSNIWFNIDSNNSDADGGRFVRYHRDTSVSAGATTLMILRDTGRLGLGTTAPDEEVHLLGNIKMVDGNQAVGKVLVSNASGDASWETAGNYIPGNLPCTGPYSTTYNGHCYQLFWGHVFNWPEAAATCANWGGYLTQITSSGENSAVTGILNGGNAWIGATDMSTEADWRWMVDHSDATTGAAYHNWNTGSGEPNDSSGVEECAQILTSGLWNDASCGGGNRFVCERDNSGTAAATGCAAISVADQLFTNDMWGCAGNVAYASRENLCASGYSACTAAEYTTNNPSASITPDRIYWTETILNYNGSAGNCWVTTSGGNSCGGSQSMKVCRTDITGDALANNNCGWINCTYLSDFGTNYYFGGCGNNSAGTLCCPD